MHQKLLWPASQVDGAGPLRPPRVNLPPARAAAGCASHMLLVGV